MYDVISLLSLIFYLYKCNDVVGVTIYFKIGNQVVMNKNYDKRYQFFIKIRIFTVIYKKRS